MKGGGLASGRGWRLWELQVQGRQMAEGLNWILLIEKARLLNCWEGLNGNVNLRLIC